MIKPAEFHATSKALVKELPILNRTKGAPAPLLPPNNSNSGMCKEMRLKKNLCKPSLHKLQREMLNHAEPH